MKKKYIEPKLVSHLIFIEDNLAAGSLEVSTGGFGGSNRPNIEDDGSFDDNIGGDFDFEI